MDRFAGHVAVDEDLGQALGDDRGLLEAAQLPGQRQALGTVDADGCLVCPWHQSRYDVRTGEMVEGPRGFLGYHGPTPGYTQLVRLLGSVARLRVRRAHRAGDDVVLD